MDRSLSDLVILKINFKSQKLLFLGRKKKTFLIIRIRNLCRTSYGQFYSK